MQRLVTSDFEAPLRGGEGTTQAARDGHEESQRAFRAAHGLKSERPEYSAGMPVWRWQKFVLTVTIVALAVGWLIAPRPVITGLFALLAVPFFFVVVLRAIALQTLWTNSIEPPGPIIAEEDLPVYSVLVPLFREADVVRDLLAALSAIDYPAGKLDILLIVECVDRETLRAISRAGVAPNVRVAVVPDGQPRTKPRALNYALELARGEYVVIYDAEDAPEPDQVRRALALLKSDESRIGCVQARLNIYNPDEGWLTRQFAIEYTALFDCLLPALQRLKLPVPLGGTSNHFPRRVLEKAGAWDPFNVTEDADLGIRLARDGLVVRVLPSTTWEEAPTSLGTWMKQRTRWLKGWMQSLDTSIG